MKILIAALLFLAATAFAASSVYDFTMPALNGTPTPLAGFKGKVVLVVNVASQCGYTPQYEGLQALYAKYKDQGFVIAGFPAIISADRSRAPMRRSALSADRSMA